MSVLFLQPGLGQWQSRKLLLQWPGRAAIVRTDGKSRTLPPI